MKKFAYIKKACTQNYSNHVVRDERSNVPYACTKKSNQPVSAHAADKLSKVGVSLPCGDGEAKEIRFAGKRVF